MQIREPNRRHFIKHAAAGAAGALAGPALLSPTSRVASNQADVLIIGAGMSGVAAGSVLRSQGINPIVLEGRPDRIGGRIWTSNTWRDAPVDLGASWLTHASINPLAKLAQTAGIRTVPSNLLNLSLSEANGDILPECEVEDLLALYFATYADVKAISLERIARGQPDIPAANAFNQVIARERLDLATRQKLNFFLNFAIQEPQASPLSDLSVNNWDNNLVLVQLYLAVFPQGYVQLVKLLAQGLDIRMNHVVREIAYGPDWVSVTTNQGTFQAPYAIVTLPHGVLRRNTVTFCPELPAWKRCAIGRLHTGLSDKFCFRFPHRFWNPEPDTLGRIAETKDMHWSTWLNFYKYTSGIPLLMVFNRSEYALALEGMSDTQVIDTAMSVLRRQYGRSIPDALGMQRSHWHADRFASGTIAHVPPGASPNDYALLGQPVGPLRFAGDSTVPEFAGLVLAAYLSGVHEAQCVLALL